MQERDAYQGEPSYRIWMWDGKRHYFYGFVESRPPGTVKIREGVPFSENDMWALGTEARLRGHYETGSGSLESLLLGARTVEPRGELEKIGGSPCHVLDADTEYGRYVLWIDPAHGYNIARVEETKRKGDLYGPLGLAWPGPGVGSETCWPSSTSGPPNRSMRMANTRESSQCTGMGRRPPSALGESATGG